MLEKAVDKLADPRDGVLLRQVAEAVELVLERVLQHIYEQVDDTGLTHDLLPLFEGQTLTGEGVAGFCLGQEEHQAGKDILNLDKVGHRQSLCVLSANVEHEMF